MPNAATKPFAVVTGASSGIGFELAKQFARNDFDVLVTADEAAITTAAREVEQLGARVTTVQADLSTTTGVEQLYDAIKLTGRPVDAAALNAGIGSNGPFVEAPLADDLTVLAVNVVATVHLAKLLSADMVARGEGRLLFTSSIVARVPSANMAIYSATKSFVQTFAQTLRTELQEAGVSVTAVQPGPTETAFFDRSDMRDTALGAGPKDNPEQVAEQAYEALMAGKDSIVAGSLLTRVAAAASAVVPGAVGAKLQGKLTEPGSAHS